MLRQRTLILIAGPIDNAYAKGYSAGGSSSGCGVLVARGESDMSIGGDQGGSVRLVRQARVRPFAKRVSARCAEWDRRDETYSWVDTLHWSVFVGEHHRYLGSNDKGGRRFRYRNLHPSSQSPSQSVLDNAVLLSAIAGSDGIDDRQGAGCPVPPVIPNYASLAKGGIDGLRIGIITESLHTEHTDERYAKSVVDAAMKFKELGAAVVEEVSVECFNIAVDVWSVSQTTCTVLC